MCRKLFVTLMIITCLVATISLVMVVCANTYNGPAINTATIVLFMFVAVVAAAALRKKTGGDFKVFALGVGAFLIFVLAISISPTERTQLNPNSDKVRVFASAWSDERVYNIVKEGEWRNPFMKKIALLPIEFSYQHGDVTVTAKITYLDLNKGLRLRDKMDEYIAPILEAATEAIYWGTGFQEADQTCYMHLEAHLGCLKEWVASAILEKMKRLNNLTAHGFFEITSVKTNKLY